MAALQYTKEDLSKLSQEELARLVLSQQEQLTRLNANIEDGKLREMSSGERLRER